jgi:putative RecB family exonuclease
MDIHELRKKPHLSASSINAYMECGLYYKFSKIDRLKREFIADNLLYGITIHEVLAEFHQERLIGKRLPCDELQDRFEAYWKQRVERTDRIRYSKNQSYEGILKGGQALLEAYEKSYPSDTYIPIAIEEPFVFKPDGVDVPLIGVMDLIEEDEDGTVIITENKTSGKAYSDAQIHQNLQLTTYQVAVRANGYKDRNIVLRIDCLIKTRTPKFQQYYTSRVPLDEHRTIKKIRKVWDAIQRGVFVPNDTSWKCPHCEYKSACNDWFEEGFGGDQ